MWRERFQQHCLISVLVVVSMKGLILARYQEKHYSQLLQDLILTRTIKDCKLPSSITIASVTPVYGFTRIDIIRCDSGATNYRTERYTGSGTQTTDIATVRTGGASDGTNSFSWKIATKTIARWTMPFVALPIAIWNSSTGSVSATVEGMADPRDFSALPNNDEVWFTVQYLGSSSTPQGSYTAGTKANKSCLPEARYQHRHRHGIARLRHGQHQPRIQLARYERYQLTLDVCFL